MLTNHNKVKRSLDQHVRTDLRVDQVRNHPNCNLEDTDSLKNRLIF
jgi:hypothetical protein